MTILPPGPGEGNSATFGERPLPPPWTEPYDFRAGYEHGLTTAQLDEFPPPVLAAYMLKKCAYPLFVDSTFRIIRNAFGYTLPSEHVLTEALETLAYDPRVIPTALANLGTGLVCDYKKRNEIFKVVQSPQAATAYNSIAGSVQEFLGTITQPGVSMSLDDLSSIAGQRVPMEVLDVITVPTLGRTIKTLLLSSDGLFKKLKGHSFTVRTREYISKERTPSLPPALLPVEIGEQVLSFVAPVTRSTRRYRPGQTAGMTSPGAVPVNPADLMQRDTLAGKIGETRIQQIHEALERIIDRYVDENTLTINSGRFVEHIAVLLRQEGSPLTTDEQTYLPLALKCHERFVEDPQRSGESLRVVQRQAPQRRPKGRIYDPGKTPVMPRYGKGWVRSVNKKD